MSLPDDSDACTVLEQLLKAILKVGDEDLLKYLDARLACMAQAESTSASDMAILQSDEGQDCLCKFDKAEYTKEASERKAKQSDSQVFVQHVRKRRTELAQKASASSSSQAGRRQKPAKKAPRLALPPGSLTQAEVKKMSPEGSYVWRNTSSQAWCGKIAPFGDVSRSWLAHGHRGAAVKLLRVLWERAISVGLATECLVQGLYSDSALEETSK